MIVVRVLLLLVPLIWIFIPFSSEKFGPGSLVLLFEPETRALDYPGYFNHLLWGKISPADSVNFSPIFLCMLF